MNNLFNGRLQNVFLVRGPKLFHFVRPNVFCNIHTSKKPLTDILVPTGMLSQHLVYLDQKVKAALP